MAIAYTTGLTAYLTTAGTTLPSGTFSATAGQTLFVAVALSSSSATVTTITDTAGNTYTRCSFSTGSTLRTELWQAKNITGNASNAVTVTASASALLSLAIGEYAGLGTQTTNNSSSFTGTGYFPRTLTAIQYQNGYAIAALGFTSNSGDTVSADIGSLRQSVIPTVTSVGIALVDITTPCGNCTVTNTVKLSHSYPWATAAFEIGDGNTNVTQYPLTGFVEPPFVTYFGVFGGNGFAYPYADFTGGSNG